MKDNHCLAWAAAAAISLSACGGGDDFAPAVISLQPQSYSAAAGSNATFSVSATGDGLTYQWQSSVDSGRTWSDIAGASAQSYAIAVVTAAMNGYQYRVVVAGPSGALTSAPATLTATAATAATSIITVQPSAQTTAAGGTTTFSFTATGTNLSYQWQLSVDGGATWANLVGAILAAYRIALTDLAFDGYLYRALVSDGVNVATTLPVKLTVARAPLLSRLSGAAYYQPQLNATVITNANLPVSLPLGVAGIGSDGTMLWSTAKAWVQALNASNYLGYSDWRLPKVGPINGTGFVVNNLAGDSYGGYSGKIDLGYGISAPATTYAGSAATELPFLFYNVLGNLAKFSPTGVSQSVAGNAYAPLTHVAQTNYWTSQPYGDTGAYAFDMQNGNQNAYVSTQAGWNFNVIVLRNGDSGP